MFTKEQIKEIVEFRTGEKVQRVDFQNWFVQDIRDPNFAILTDDKRLRFIISLDGKVSTMDNEVLPQSARINLDLWDGSSIALIFPRQTLGNVVFNNMLTGVIFKQFDYSNSDITLLNGYYNLFYADCILAN